MRLAVDDEVVDIDLDATGPVEPDRYDIEDDGVWVQANRGFAPHRFSFPGSTMAHAGATASDGKILAPMPGRVTAVEVGVSETVTEGQRLVTLEAMKMEHSLTAPFDGTVTELNAEPGAQVSEGTLLVRIEKAE